MCVCVHASPLVSMHEYAHTDTITPVCVFVHIIGILFMGFQSQQSRFVCGHP